MSWAAHDLEPYVVQKHLGKRVAFVPLLVGSYAPDLLSKWFVYGVTLVGVELKADVPAQFHRGWPGVGFTHSLVFGVLVGLLLYLVWRNKVVAYSFVIGQWAHALTDTGDTVGTMLLFPFTDHLFAAGAWAYAGQTGRYVDAGAYFSGLGFVWDGIFVVWAILSWRVLTRGYFRTTVMAADPFWRWAGRHLSETTLVALYRASFFYGVARWTAWLLWAHVVRSFAFDLRWGGPRWVPRIYADELNQAAPAACRCAGCCSMTPRLGFYGVVAVCAWVKGHSGRSRDAEDRSSAPETPPSPSNSAQAPLAGSRFLSGMAHSGWITFTRAASIAGLAIFAVATVFSSPGGNVESFFNVWFYNGLLILACVIVSSRALLVPRERAAWTAFAAAMACWIFGEIWYAAVHPETFPSVGDVGFIGFYPLTYLGMVALLRSRTRAIGGTLWLDGLTASLAAAALGAAVLVELVLRSTEGSHFDRRDEPRLPARRPAAALRGLRRLLAHPLAPGTTLAAPRPRRPVDRPGRRHLPLPECRRHIRRGVVDRHSLARGAPPHRVVGVGRRPEQRGARVRRQAAARGSGRLRPRRDCRSRLRPFPAGQRSRRRPRGGHAAGGRRPPRRHVPREPPALRADPRGGGYRCADRSRQSAEAARRSRARPRGAGRDRPS